MRSYQIFAAMTPERAEQMMKTLADKAPGMYAQAVAAASISMKARPKYLQRQPFEKRAAAIRRSLSRVATNPVADELLAVYFLECRKELLTEWLDLLGLEHEEGSLKDDEPSEPEEQKLAASLETYRAADDDPDRELLLLAFAAQAVIEWPRLDAALEAGD